MISATFSLLALGSLLAFGAAIPQDVASGALFIEDASLGRLVPLVRWNVNTTGTVDMAWTTGGPVTWVQDGPRYYAPIPASLIGSARRDRDGHLLATTGERATSPLPKYSPSGSSALEFDALLAERFSVNGKVAWKLISGDFSGAIAPPDAVSVEVALATGGGQPDSGGPAGVAPPTGGSGLHALRAYGELTSAVESLDTGDPLSVEARTLLENPNAENQPLLGKLFSDHGFQVLKDLDIGLITFDTDDESGLGLNYSYNKSRDLSVHEAPGSVRGLGWSISTQGNVAFDSDVNPSDFLKSQVSLDYFQSKGGVKGDASPETTAKVLELYGKATHYTDDDEFRKSDEFRQMRELVQGEFDTQWYWEVAGSATLESNQSFTMRNQAVGVHAALDVKDWGRANYNILDYPAAILRLLTGYDDSFRPRGHALPTLLIGYDYVNPEGQTPRAMLGDESSYGRLQAEVGYKSPIGTLDETTYYVSVSWRYYDEVDAASSVRAAGLDSFDFLQISIESDNGLFASYGSGQQPFDVGDDEFVQLGWRYSL